MYKKQFKKWGFEKNVTQKRAYKLMDDDTATDSVRKFIGMDRIGQYFKRRKAVHDITASIVSSRKCLKLLKGAYLGANFHDQLPHFVRILINK